jgi:hypothetical protein
LRDMGEIAEACHRLSPERCFVQGDHGFHRVPRIIFGFGGTPTDESGGPRYNFNMY